jgi:tetratricopeptide (TPR) repeat protein
MTRWVPLLLVPLLLVGCTTGAAVRHTTSERLDATEQSVELISLERLRALLGQGDAAAGAGRSEEAMRYYLLAEQLLATAFATGAPFPEGFLGDEVLWRIALIHEAQHRWQAAHDTWVLAASRADRDGENLQRLGWSRLQLRQYMAAREAFNAALIHDADHLQARLGLALANEGLGEWSLAIQHLEEVLHREPALQQARLARARIALRQDDLVVAKAELRLAFQAHTQTQSASQIGIRAALDTIPERYTLLGELLAREGDYGSALKVYVKYLPLHAAFSNLGQIAMRERDYALAMRYFEQAIKESPQYREQLNKQFAVAQELHRSALDVTH